MINLSQKPDIDQSVDLGPASRTVGFATHVGRFIAAGFGCGILGAIAGAILGALAALPFILFGGPFIGSILGAIGGFVAGFIGGVFGGSHRFCTGGIIGGVVSIIVYPLIIILLIPPFLAIGAGYLFGDYLDQEINKEDPGSVLARMMKRFTSGMDSYPGWIRITYGIAGLMAFFTALFLLARSYIFS